MRQSKYQYFRNGVDNQKRADVTIDLKRVDVKKIREWSLAQKLQALAYVQRWRNYTDLFFTELEKELKS
jgi:hypothetical protein